MPRPEMLVMDGAANLLTETRVGFGVVQVESLAAEEIKLVDGETELPRDVGPMDGGISVLWGFCSFSSLGVRHGIPFNWLREWDRL